MSEKTGQFLLMFSVGLIWIGSVILIVEITLITLHFIAKLW
jgi:hypothetical protein